MFDKEMWITMRQEEGVPDDWYARCIEEPLIDLVKLLRNNGFNTNCSCGHDMWIQLEWSRRDAIKELCDILYINALQNYNITIKHSVTNGHPRTWCQIDIKESMDDILKRKKEWKDKGITGE